MERKIWRFFVNWSSGLRVQTKGWWLTLEMQESWLEMWILVI